MTCLFIYESHLNGARTISFKKMIFDDFRLAEDITTSILFQDIIDFRCTSNHRHPLKVNHCTADSLLSSPNA